jgi:hypothetical protein
MAIPGTQGVVNGASERPPEALRPRPPEVSSSQDEARPSEVATRVDMRPEQPPETGLSDPYSARHRAVAASLERFAEQAARAARIAEGLTRLQEAFLDYRGPETPGLADVRPPPHLG